MKKQKKRNSIRTPEITGAGPLDWTPLFAAFREAFEWALDVAVGLAGDFPEEVEAVERVRTFMRARIAGQPSHVRVDDGGASSEGEGGHRGSRVRADPWEPTKRRFGVRHLAAVALDHGHGRSVQPERPTWIAEPAPCMDRIAGC